MENEQRVVLTGFMGVGKSTVARFLASMLDCRKIDLDSFIEQNEQRTIAEIIRGEGVNRFREIETENLRAILSNAEAKVVALGGGAWTIAENRRLIKERKFVTIWLESTFEHCWRNIKMSKRDRPLAQNKPDTLKLFEERERVYCLADWHFIIRPDFTSFEVAKKIADEVFSVKIN